MVALLRAKIRLRISQSELLQLLFFQAVGFEVALKVKMPLGIDFQRHFVVRKTESIGYCDLFLDLHSDRTRRVFPLVECCGAIK